MKKKDRQGNRMTKKIQLNSSIEDRTASLDELAFGLPELLSD